MKIPVAVLGATGSVGQNFISLLSSHPMFEITSLFASKDYESYNSVWRSPLLKPELLEERTVLKGTFDNIINSKVKLVFSAIPGGKAGELESLLSKAGIHVFSNASDHRMDSDVPIIIPEINSNHIEICTKAGRDGLLIANSNCTTSGLTMAVASLRSLKIKSIRVATYQALSGAGYPGVPSLDILGNVIPYIKGEEDKIEEESLKILGSVNSNTIIPADIDIVASTVRVAVAHGHLEAVFIEVEDEFSIDDIHNLMANFKSNEVVTSLPSTPEKSLKIFKDPLRPQPALDVMEGKGMTVSVGSIKKHGQIISFKILVNNVIRGAAGGSVQNAELAVMKGLIK